LSNPAKTGTLRAMKIRQAGSHLDHMLRQTRMHHTQLSTMADLKANGLMTIAAIMLTFSAPFVAREQFKPAVIILMIFSLATIVLAIITVLPGPPLRLRKGQEMDVSQPSFNLLFFGCFAPMNYTQFSGAMEEMMNDVSKSYEVQVREIYTLGSFLAKKKYRFLRLAYLTFATGLVASLSVLSWSLL